MLYNSNDEGLEGLRTYMTHNMITQHERPLAFRHSNVQSLMFSVSGSFIFKHNTICFKYIVKIYSFHRDLLTVVAQSMNYYQTNLDLNLSPTIY